MSTKSVVIACDTFAPDRNGTATFAKNLATSLQQEGYEVHVIAPATSKLYGTFRENHDGVALVVHRLKSFRLPFQPVQRFVSPLGLARKLRGLIGAIAPDVIHIQSHLNIGHYAAGAARSAGIRLVATNHLDAENFIENVIMAPRFVKSFLATLFMRSASDVFRSADAVIAPNLRAAQMLESVIPNLKVFAVSGGVNLRSYRNLEPAKQANHLIVYVGRLDREKHVYVMLEALARLPKHLKLEVIGSGSQHSELLALAQELKIESRVSFLDDLDNFEVAKRLGRATVFVMPSTQELQSMATLEAMAAGRPIVAANSMALPNLVEDGINGYLFKPDSPTDLAEKLEAIFKLDAKAFENLCHASVVRASQHDLAKTVANYERIYAGLEPILSNMGSEGGYEAEPSVTTRIARLVRRGSKSLERGANGVIERLDGVRGAVTESFGEVRFVIERRSRRVARKLSSSFRKALERIRKDE
jgi:glycosyltransferase involved in cell wall biosynthesis